VQAGISLTGMQLEEVEKITEGWKYGAVPATAVLYRKRPV